MPHQAYINYRETFYKYISIYGTVVGANMTDATFRPSFLTYMWLGANLSYNASVFYTMIAFRHLDVSWQSACVQGLCMQVIIVRYYFEMLF